jgi:hypothetical protein
VSTKAALGFVFLMFFLPIYNYIRVEVHWMRDMTLTSNQTEKDLILLGLGIINGMIRNDSITIPMLKHMMDRMGGKDPLMKIIKDLVDRVRKE